MYRMPFVLSIQTNSYTVGVLQHKTILIISPQDWGKMLLSKHHYALELAKAGNTVYFLQPPDQKAELPYNSVTILESGLHKNLFMIQHRLFFPFWLKFKAMPVFHALMKQHIRKILKTIDKNIDIIWSFDIGNLYPLDLFPKQSLKVFHPVDEPLQPEAVRAAKGAGIIFSVTNEILSKYENYKLPMHFIHHGVSENFLHALGNGTYTTGQPLKVGYAGNLLRNDVDRSTLLVIINENPEVEFHFFGSYKLKQTNIGGSEDEGTKEFIKKLEQLPNVKLHGVLGQEELATAFAAMDAFLVCYDIEKDQSRGTNYHKLMEYLATGRVIIANNITTYASMPGLIQMTTERTHNNGLPGLFKSVISNLSYHNSPERLDERKRFAASNTYQHQVSRIGEILEPLLPK